MKKLLTSVVAAATVLTIGMSAQAETPSEQPSQQPAEQHQTKQDFEAKYKEAQEKFDALTDKQKKELYDCYDKINVQKLKLLDKYVEYGLISKEEADVIRTEMAAHSKEMRESQKLVPFVGMHKHKAPEHQETANEKEVAPESDQEKVEEKTEEKSE